MNKRGVFFFVIDVLIAVLIFVVTIVVLASFFVPRTSIGGTQQYVDVLQEDFFNQRIGELNSNDLQYVPDKYKYEYDLRIDELLYLILLDDEVNNATATSLFNSLIDVVPEQFGVEYSILYTSFSPSRQSTRVLSKQEARTVLERKTVTIPPQKYCDGVCKTTISRVAIWS